MDFSGAFDRMPKQVLIPQLMKVADKLDGDEKAEFLTLTRWVDDFFQDRSVRVKCGDALSSCREMGVGVPQGTVMGPAVWKIFLAELQESLAREGIEHLAFADDLLLLFECESSEAEEANIQRALDEVVEWAGGVNMELSPDKTKMMIFGSSRAWGTKGEVPDDTPKVKIGRGRVARVKEHKYLGIKIDEKLKFESQVKEVLRKCKQRLGCLRRLCDATWKPDSFLVLSFHRALIESIWAFGIGAWGPYLSAEQRVKMDKVQNEAAKCILGVRDDTDNRIARAETGLLGVADVIKREAAFLVICGRTREPECEGDPLERVVEGESKWAEVGKSFLSVIGCNKGMFVPDVKPKPGDEDDIFQCINDGSLVIDLATAPENEIQELHGECTYVAYTDGSVKDGYGGAAIVIFRRWKTEHCNVKDAFESESFAVQERADSFIAEQEALLRVVRAVREKAVNGDRVAILSDSLANIMSIYSPGNRDEKESQIKKEIKKACEAGVTILLKHVKGHSGALGNEIADHEAGVRMEEVREQAEPRKILKGVARSMSSSRVAEQARKRWNVIAGQEADLGGLGSHGKRMGPVGVNPVLKKGTRGEFSRKNEIVYSHMRLGVPIVIGESDTDGRSVRKVWSCACQRVGKGRNAVEHILFNCPEYEEERARMKEQVEQKVKEERHVALEKGLTPRGGSWGKLKVINECPGATMGFIADALGCGYGTAKEENEREGGKKGGKKGSGKGKGYGKSVKSAML